MRYLFRDRWFDVPEYAPHPSCVLVEVRCAVALARVEPRDRRRVGHDWRKLLRFVAVEGLGGTVRKTRSKLLEERATSDLHVVVALGTAPDGGEVLCLGTKHPRYAEVLPFEPGLVRDLSFRPQESALVAACEEVVREFGREALERVAGFDLYSGVRPPPEATAMLRATAGLLAASREAADDDRPRRARPPAPRLPGAAGLARPADRPARSPGRVRATVIGAGDYVRATASPALRRAGASLDTIVDLDPLLAELARTACGFARAATDWRAAVRRLDAGLVVVASYHASHAEIASFALRDGKAVLVEKPPAVTAEDLEELASAASLPGAFLEVGYNRRFAPLTRAAKALIDGARGPVAMTFVVQELRLPAGHWYRWPGQGTRVTGNLCHWIDLAAFFLGPECAPERMTLAGHDDENQTLTIEFEDGSVATIVATSHGDETLGVQETLHVRRGDLTIAIDDFRSLAATRAGRTVRRVRGPRDKGHRAMYCETVERVRAGLPARYGVAELRLTTSMVIRAASLFSDLTQRRRAAEIESSAALRLCVRPSSGSLT